jgi:hypothetical protein
VTQAGSLADPEMPALGPDGSKRVGQIVDQARIDGAAS